MNLNITKSLLHIFLSKTSFLSTSDLLLIFIENKIMCKWYKYMLYTYEEIQQSTEKISELLVKLMHASLAFEFCHSPIPSFNREVHFFNIH